MSHSRTPKVSRFLKGGPGTSPEVTRADSPGGSFDLCKVLHTRLNCPILRDKASGPSGPRTAARSPMGPGRARPACGRHAFLSRAVELARPPPGGLTGSWGSSRRLPLPPSMTCSRWQGCHHSCAAPPAPWSSASLAARKEDSLLFLLLWD